MEKCPSGFVDLIDSKKLHDAWKAYVMAYVQSTVGLSPPPPPYAADDDIVARTIAKRNLCRSCASCKDFKDYATGVAAHTLLYAFIFTAPSSSSLMPPASQAFSETMIVSRCIDVKKPQKMPPANLSVGVSMIGGGNHRSSVMVVAVSIG